MIVMMAGLPGTGKSTVAAAAVQGLERAGVPSRVVNKDTLRAALFDPGQDPYSAGQNDFLLELMLATARYWLRMGVRVVFLDGRTFSQAYQRQQVLDAGAPVLAVECVCPPELALARIAGDRDHAARDRDGELYGRVAAAFEPITGPALRLDTGRPLEASVTELLKAIERLLA